MSYQEKYFHTYCDPYGNTLRISLQVWEYTGSATEVDCGSEQFYIERESASELKLGGVFPTRATATFESSAGFDLQELYTGDERTYLLVLYKNGVMDWQGNVVPDGFQQDNFDTERSHLSVRATDNLSTLKGKQFVDEYGDNYGDDDGQYMESFLWVIKEALKKTGFLMPIWSMVDIKALESSGSEPTGIVLARRGHFNDVSPSEIGVFKQGADFGFLKIGDRVKITESAAGNNGTYTVTGFVSSVPPDSPYIRIQLSPQVPVQIHENVVMEIISTANSFPDPLTTVHNIRTWIRDSNIEGATYYDARGGAMMTWDVMDAIARQFGVVIQQNQGHWEIRRWNADKIDPGVYQWYVYNSEGVQIGREDFGTDVLMPCKPTQQSYRIFGSKLMMDRVLKYAVVNYRYKYNLLGDTLPNLVVNGNFEGAFNPAPRGWNRVKADNVNPVIVPLMTISKETTDLPPGFTEALRIVNYADTRTLDNLTDLSNSEVNKGDDLLISWWEKIDGADRLYNAVYSISVFESLTYARATSSGAQVSMFESRRQYSLVLNGAGTGLSPLANDHHGLWVESSTDNISQHFRFQTTSNQSGGFGQWRKITVKAPSVPINGFLKFEILGVAYPYPDVAATLGGASTRIKMVPVYKPSQGSLPMNARFEAGWITMLWQGTGISLLTTGISISKLIDPDNEAVPQIDPFMYPDFQAQLDRRYSDTIPETEVLTGDDYGEFADDRISGMWIDGNRTTMWDTWDNRFGWSRQGLVLAKSIMEMYWTPTRLLDCEIHLPDLHWSSRLQFEELPGKRFVILRGRIGGRDGAFRGTLTEIHDNAEPALPPGGNDGDNTTNPNWQPTGISRCVLDDNGVNTGQVEQVQVDINRASPTFGQERWVLLAGTDTDRCPVGAPTDLYWGEQASLEVSSLRAFPLYKDGDNYGVQFSNDGSDVYLRVLHRAVLGTVRSILYPGGYESISGWVYESDITINGYIYKHLRLTWVTGVYTNLPVTFKIN